MSHAIVDRLNSRKGLARCALVAAMSRSACIRLLVWNDRGNGCYTDEDNAAEDHPPLTLLELHCLVLAYVCDEHSGLSSPTLNPDGATRDNPYAGQECTPIGFTSFNERLPR